MTQRRKLAGSEPVPRKIGSLSSSERWAGSALFTQDQIVNNSPGRDTQAPQALGEFEREWNLFATLKNVTLIPTLSRAQKGI